MIVFMAMACQAHTIMTPIHALLGLGSIPILALFVCFNTIPLIRGVVYSFTNFRGFGKYDWVGQFLSKSARNASTSFSIRKVWSRASTDISEG